MEDFKSISYKYNSRTKRYTIYTDRVIAINKALTKLLGKSAANIIMVKISKTSFDIYEFFLLELQYCLDLMKTEEHLIAVEMGGILLNDLLEFINTKTWVATRKSLDVLKLFDFNNLKKTMKYQPLPHQYDMFKKYEEIKNTANLRGGMLHADPGTGKALRNGTPVLTPKGFVPIETLKVGDSVIGDNGRKTKVLGVYPQGVRKLVCLKFKDGRKIPCDLDHLWKVKSSCSKIEKDYVYKTKDIISLLKKGCSLKIPTCDRVNIYKRKDNYIIDSYILGVLLSSPVDIKDNEYIITNKFTTNDDYIVNKVTSLLPEGYYLLKKKLNLVNVYIIRKKNSTKNIFIDELKNLKIYNKSNVRIPYSYIYTNVKHRFNILQGILDSKGCVDVEYTLRLLHSNKNLLSSIQEIVWSLGDICSIKKQVPLFSICKNNTEYDILSITTNNHDRYLSSEKKLSKVGRKVNDMYLDIIGYEVIEDDEATCIAVDNKSKLFITENYIVTHNTYVSLAVSELLDYDLIIVIAPKSTIIDPWYDSVTTNLYNKKQSSVIFNSKQSDYNNEKFILTHYEFLPKLMSNKKLARRIKKIHPMLIIDEFHNFNEIKNQRANDLISFVKYMKFTDILLLTGTPIKMNVKELVPMLFVLDEKFPKVVDFFTSLYSNIRDIKRDMLHYRFNLYKERVQNTDKSMGEISITDYRVRIKNSDKFLLSNINDRMKDYRVHRTAELLKEMDSYREEFKSLIIQAIENNDIDNKIIKHYYFLVNVIRNHSDNGKLYKVYDKVSEAKEIEKEYILKYLKGNDKHRFRELSSIVKYPKLKVLGEALGKILLGSRIECYNELAKVIEYKKLLLLTNKKGLIFSNYTSVCNTAIEYCRKDGFNPVGVYGEYIPDLDNNVKLINDLKSNVNPIVSTYKSLSTGVPLPSVNVIILIDTALRSYIITQALSRAYRIGNKENVSVFFTKLDTDNYFNITDRDLFIVNTSEYNVEMITGDKPIFDIPRQELESEECIEEIEEEIEEELINSFNLTIDNDVTDYIKSFLKKIKIV